MSCHQPYSTHVILIERNESWAIPPSYTCTINNSSKQIISPVPTISSYAINSSCAMHINSSCTSCAIKSYTVPDNSSCTINSYCFNNSSCAIHFGISLFCIILFYSCSSLYKCWLSVNVLPFWFIKTAHLWIYFLVWWAPWSYNICFIHSMQVDSLLRSVENMRPQTWWNDVCQLGCRHSWLYRWSNRENQGLIENRRPVEVAHAYVILFSETSSSSSFILRTSLSFFHAKLGSDVCPGVRQPNLCRHFTKCWVPT